MNVGQLRYLLRDVDPDVEVCLMINVGSLSESGAVYASATDIDYSDVEKHCVVYVEANEY